MRIFVLEDNPARTYRFTSMFVGHRIDITADAGLAINMLKKDKYDFIFLDHDLGGHVYVDSFNNEQELTGYTVALQIPNTINSDTKVVIHSHNPIGAVNMQSVLTNAIYAPFGTFNEDIIEEGN